MRISSNGVGLGFAAALFVPAAYATLILYPLAVENEAIRERTAGLAALFDQVARLDESITGIRRDIDAETPAYQALLRDLRDWRIGAHIFVSRMAADARLEVTAMEWTEAETADPAFETGKRLPWLHTSVFNETHRRLASPP